MTTDAQDLAEMVAAADWQCMTEGLAYLKMLSRPDGKVEVRAHGMFYAEAVQRDDETRGQTIARAVAATYDPDDEETDR